VQAQQTTVVGDGSPPARPIGHRAEQGREQKIAPIEMAVMTP
jgi:hypothetical protein